MCLKTFSQCLRHMFPTSLDPPRVFPDSESTAAQHPSLCSWSWLSPSHPHVFYLNISFGCWLSGSVCLCPSQTLYCFLKIMSSTWHMPLGVWTLQLWKKGHAGNRQLDGFPRGCWRENSCWADFHSNLSAKTAAIVRALASPGSLREREGQGREWPLKKRWTEEPKDHTCHSDTHGVNVLFS